MTTTAPVAAIVITNRDYGRFLAEAIESALAQGTPGTVEVVVVDDGSTDDSLDVAAGYADRIRLVRSDGAGQGAAMQAGLAQTGAPVVVFLDADDRLADGLVDRVVPHFDDPGVARVHFPLCRVDSLSRPRGGTVPPVIAALPSGDLRRAVAAHPDDMAWQPTSGNAYRRSVLDAILPMPVEDYRISADHHLNALSALHGRVERLTEIGGDYRIHGANADARDHFDLAKTQGIVARSLVTQAEVVRTARALGIPASPAGRSISFQTNRLVSHRLGRATHPIAGDTSVAIWRDAVGACWSRRDLRLRRRLAGVGFVSALAVAPTALVPRLLAGVVVGTTDPAPRSVGATRPPEVAG